MSSSLLESLSGIWHCEVPSDENGVLLVFVPGGRVLQFPPAGTTKPTRHILRLWVSGEGDHHLRLRGAPDATGWLRRVDRTDTGITLVAESENRETCFPCRRPEKGSLPGWWDEAVEENLAIMDEVEKNTRKARGVPNAN